MFATYPRLVEAAENTSGAPSLPVLHTIEKHVLDVGRVLVAVCAVTTLPT